MQKRPAVLQTRQLTFQGEGLVDAPGGLLQLGVLAGVQLRGPRWLEVGVGVRLDGCQRRTVGIGVALLYWEEGAAGFGAGHFDASLVGRVSAVGWRRPQRLLGGAATVEGLVWRGRLPAVGLGLLALQLLLLPPHIIQKNVAVARSSSTTSSSPCPAPVRKSVGQLCPSAGVCPSGPQRTVLWGADALQQPVGAVTVASYVSFQLGCRTWVRGPRGGRGVLGARGEGRRGGGVRRGKRGLELVGPVTWNSVWRVVSEKQHKGFLSGSLKALKLSGTPEVAPPLEMAPPPRGARTCVSGGVEVYVCVCVSVGISVCVRDLGVCRCVYLLCTEFLLVLFW